MNRSEYLRQVLSLYLQAPDTPHRVRGSDRGIASTFYQQKISLADLRYAIALVSLQRARRASHLPALEPIGSLAYFRPVVEGLRHKPVDPGYALYVLASYRNLLDEVGKTAMHRQNAAVLGRR